MKRCSFSSLTRRACSPAWRDSTSSIASRTVLPAASTDFSPPVWVRRMVGMETFTAMVLPPLGCCWWQTFGRSLLFHDLDRFLGDDAVHDAVRPELVLVRVLGGHQHVVGFRFGGVRHIGARRVRVGRG